MLPQTMNPQWALATFGGDAFGCALSRLHPRWIMNAIVYWQAATRRHLYAKKLQQRAMSAASLVAGADEDVQQLPPLPPQPPAPPVACGLYFTRRLHTMACAVDAENEAFLVVSVLCARERPPLGALAAACDTYTNCLPAEHPASSMLAERLAIVIPEADEEAFTRLKGVKGAAEARAILVECRRAWDAPAAVPGSPENGERFFVAAEGRARHIEREVEAQLRVRLRYCETETTLVALASEIDRELTSIPTTLHVEVRQARQRRKEHLEAEIVTRFGWPPTGPLPLLASAGRRYFAELGATHPTLQDYVNTVRELRVRLETRMIEELGSFEVECRQLRCRMIAQPPPVALLMEGYRQQLNEKVLQANQLLDDWGRQVGFESPLYGRFSGAILGNEKCEANWMGQAERSAAEIRCWRMVGTGDPSDEEGLDVAATRIIQLLASLEAIGKLHADAAELKAELKTDLERARPAALLFDMRSALHGVTEDAPEQPEAFGDGPAEPVGDTRARGVTFSQPWEPPPPEPEPEKVIETPREIATLTAGVRLHGVSLADVQGQAESELWSRCATVIARECGIPLSCVRMLGFTVSKVEASPMVSTVIEGESFAWSPSMSISAIGSNIDVDLEPRPSHDVNAEECSEFAPQAFHDMSLSQEELASAKSTLEASTT